MLSLNPTLPRDQTDLPIQTVNLQNRSELDEKVYWYVGRTLQGISAAGLVGSAAAFYIIAWPFALAATVTSFVLLMLGTFFTEDFFASSTNPPPPGGAGDVYPDGARIEFVPGQPVGIHNGGSNCWAVSTMQMIMNVPSLVHGIENDVQFAGVEFEPLREFIRQYREAQQNQQPVPNLQAYTLRQVLHTINNVFDLNGNVQEDAGEAFLMILGRLQEGTSVSHRLNISYDAVQSDGHTVGRTIHEQHESIIQLDLNDENASFEERLDAFFNREIPHDAPQIRSRPEVRYQDGAPREFILQTNRFVYRERTTGDPSTTYSVKLNTLVAVPQRFTLSGNYVLTGQEGQYECDAFVEHRGLNMGSGHYVSYIKKDNRWWCCNDTRVTPVSLRTVDRAMRRAYFYHFKAV